MVAAYNRQHRNIFNALNERDAQGAYIMITEHLEKARDDRVKANSPLPTRADQARCRSASVAALSWGVYDFLSRFPFVAPSGPIPTVLAVTLRPPFLLSAWVLIAGRWNW